MQIVNNDIVHWREGGGCNETRLQERRRNGQI